MAQAATRHVRDLEARIAALEQRLADEDPPAAGAARGGSGRRRVGVVAAVVAALALLPGAVFAGVLFNDVEPTNQFISDIAAIASAGVTQGCGNGNFCPKDFVTREQMAAFLNRLGALGPGKPPVANARELQGYLAGDIARTADARTTSLSAALTGTEITYLSGTLTAPSIGYVVVTMTMTGREVACTMNCVLAARVRHVETGFHSPYTESWVHERESLAVTHRFAVDPGTHTFQIRLHRPTAGDGNLNGWYGQMTVLYVPFGGSGQPPT